MSKNTMGITRNQMRRWRRILECGATVTDFVNGQVIAAEKAAGQARDNLIAAYAPLGTLVAGLWEIQESSEDARTKGAIEAGVLHAPLEANKWVIGEKMATLQEGLAVLRGHLAEATRAVDTINEAVCAPDFFLTLLGTSVSAEVRYIIRHTGAKDFETFKKYLGDKAPEGLKEKLAILRMLRERTSYVTAIGEEGYEALLWDNAVAYSITRAEGLLGSDAVTAGGSRRRKHARRYRKFYQRILKDQLPKMPARYRKAVEKARAAALATAEEMGGSQEQLQFDPAVAAHEADFQEEY